MAEEKWTIEKLDGTNWSAWKFHMRHMLLLKGLWGIVDGTDTLAEDANDEDQATYATRSLRAFSYIAMAVGASQLYLITSTEDPRAAWDALRSHFDRDTLANKLFLKKQYFRAEMKEGTSTEAHLKQMKEITDRLAVIGAPISEEDQVVTLLGSLPRSYSTLVTALEARGDDLTLRFVQQALIQEEQKRKGITPEDNRSTALVGSAHRHKRKNLKCFNCKQPGHFFKDCPKGRSHYHDDRRSTAQDQKTAHKAKTVTAVTEEENISHEFEVVSEDVFAALDGSTTYAGGWLIDSGASSHMTYQRDILADYHEFEQTEKVGLGDGRTVDVVGAGKVYIQVKNTISSESRVKRFCIENVLLVPKLACSLFSVRAATSHGHSVKFSKTKCWIRNPKGKLCAIGTLEDKLYRLECTSRPAEQTSLASVEVRQIDLWHQRLGHLNNQYINKLIEKEMATGIKIPKAEYLSFCEGCIDGKIRRSPFKPVGAIRSQRKLELVHSDVCGPMSVESLGGHKYFVTFIDDYSRSCAVYFIKQKAEVFEKFKEFEAAVTNATGSSIGALRSDNGGEYLSTEFVNYLKCKGIQHELTVPNTPEQNGVSERMNRTLMESARSMLSHAGLQNNFWAEAVATAAYVRNRSPTSALSEGVTPYQKWYGRKPNLEHLKVFGCIAYAHVPDSQRRKLDKKAKKFRFVGYSIQSKGYRLLDEDTKRVLVRRDVVFNESNFGEKMLVNDEGSVESLEVSCKQGYNPETVPNHSQEQVGQDQDEQIEERTIRRSERRRCPPVRYGCDEYVDLAAESEVRHVAYLSQVSEPISLKEALQSKNARDWKQAADTEYNALVENKTWDLVEPPVGCKPIGCRWLFKVKHTSTGEIEKFKGRLVAKGYSQTYGIDYVETFSPVVKFSSIRALLAYAVENNMEIHQMDVVTAFLNGELDEDIYMDQPEGYTLKGKEHLVCKLRKSLYGLKQSPRCWNATFSEHMHKAGFNQSPADPCVFIRHTCKLEAIVAVYVDDLIVITKSIEDMNSLKVCLADRFKMKDMGELHYCLGISIERDEEKKSLYMHQKQYITNTIEKFGLSNCKVVSTPADINVKLTKDEEGGTPVDPVMYQSIVGSLLYVAIATRPDIAQAVGVVSKFNSKPSQTHLSAAKRILRYLRGTSDLVLKFQQSEKGCCLVGYSDADWAGDHDDRHSTTGNLFQLAGGPISWLSKKQSVVALSTSEAEYVSLSTCAQEAIWLRRLLNSIKAIPPGPTVINEDNQGAIAIAKNPIAHGRTKHIDIRYHFIRETIQDRSIELCYCPSEEMIADLLTKPLSKGKFEKLRELMGIKNR